jgi:predicted kinase
MANRAVLHLICGQAGSGKTTYAKQLETELNAFRFTKDEWMVSLYGRHITLDEWSQYEPRCYACIETIARRLLEREISVILDYGFWYRHERARAKDFANELGVRSVFHFLNVPVEVRRDRVLRRNKSIANDSVVMSEEEFDKQLSWFEVPSEHEGLSVKLIEVIEGITI